MNNALLAIGLSVLMHVSWNLLARHVSAKCNFLWWGLLVHLILLGPWALWRLIQDSHWTEMLIIAILISALANSIYFIALRQAYRSGPVALVYPIARSSPILIALWAWFLFAEQVSFFALAGICISVIGLWFLAGSARHNDSKNAVLWAILAALMTSVYSLSDKLAVIHLPDFGAQLGFITIGYGVSFIVLTLLEYRETGQFIPVCRPDWPYLIFGGLCIGTAYALVVRAMLTLPAAYVVAYTNAGIILASLLSIFVFKERQHWQRRLLSVVVIGAGLIVLGFN